MSDSSGERQFEASAARLRRAREEGDLPRSADLSGAVAFATGVATLAATLPSIVGISEDGVRRAALQLRADASDVIALFVSAVVIPMGACGCAGLLAGAAQMHGLHFRFPTLSLSRLNPIEGLRRAASRETAIAVARGAVAVACMIALLGPLACRVLAQALRSEEAPALGAVAWSGAICVGVAGSAFAALFGGFDFLVALTRWRKRLRMTREEFKRDQKESEGDPLLRSRRRSDQRKHARLSVQRVVEAAFVVVNPTHVAVALEYDPPAINVPRVLIRAVDELALRLREEANSHDVPVVEDAALARALYATTYPGEPIPLEFYIAVAAIVVALARQRLL